MSGKTDTHHGHAGGPQVAPNQETTMQPTPTTEMEVIDQLSARLQVLEAQAIAFQEEGAEALRRLSPDILGKIFWGIQQAATDCRALVNQLDEARHTRAPGAALQTAAAA